MLKLEILDRPSVHRLLLPALAERIVQEEAWSATSWPDGEEPVADHIWENAGGLRDELREVVADYRAAWQAQEPSREIVREWADRQLERELVREAELRDKMPRR